MVVTKGKSSFIGALTGRARLYGSVEGRVAVKTQNDGVWRADDYLRAIADHVAFVPQEDSVMRWATVTQNLLFKVCMNFDLLTEFTIVTH